MSIVDYIFLIACVLYLLGRCTQVEVQKKGYTTIYRIVGKKKKSVPPET